VALQVVDGLRLFSDDDGRLHEQFEGVRVGERVVQFAQLSVVSVCFVRSGGVETVVVAEVLEEGVLLLAEISDRFLHFKL
jgi:hypothetical protein